MVETYLTKDRMQEEEGMERSKKIEKRREELRKKEGSLIKRVFKYLDRYPFTDVLGLCKSFPESNLGTLKDYHWRWRKSRGRKLKSKKKTGLWKKIKEFLDANPNTTVGKLRDAFPRDNMDSVTRYFYQYNKKPKEIIKPTVLKDRVLEEKLIEYLAELVGITDPKKFQELMVKILSKK